MASSSSIYQRRSDQVADSATITIETGTDPGDTNYAPASLVDENPAKVAKILSTTAAWLFDFGSAQRVDLVALIHHNFDAGADVKLQGNASNSWGAPTLNAAITVPTWLGTGTGRWPVNPWRNLTGVAGYSASGFRYWRLVITSNSQNVQLGEIWLGSTIRTLTPGVRYGLSTRKQRPIIENRTSYGVSTIYSRLTQVWRLEGERRFSEAQLADLDAHWQDVEGRTHPWLFIPDGLATESGAYMVRYAETELGLTFGEWQGADQRFLIEEVGRGLRPGT